MKEIRNIVAAAKIAHAAGRQVALATVAHVEGSSYRRPGARMLVEDDGRLTGAISGGCLEGDALRKALLALAQQRPVLVTYDTMDDDDAKFGVGLGCNGIIQVLIEPIDPAEPNNPLALLERILTTRQKAVLVTRFSLEHKKDPQQGTALLLLGNDPSPALFADSDAQLLADSRDALQVGASSFRNYKVGGQEVTAFIEVLQPGISLVIAGAGNDVRPLVEMAAILGWETTVVDGRPNYAQAERFIPSCQVLVAKPEQVLQKITVDTRTVFLLMTHNYHYDLAILAAVLDRETPFIGILGPRKKLERMLGELEEKGVAVTEAHRNKIHSPIGLDIAAETPEEIALSILAEIQATLQGGAGKALRDFPNSIHNRQATRIQQATHEQKEGTIQQ